jgi:hypothetical protein
MAEFPDVYAWIKLVDKSTGKAFASGRTFQGGADVTVRYVLANDSHKPAGPLTVVGVLRKNGKKIQPAGKPNVVPAQQVTLQPNTVWKAEYEVDDNAGKGLDTFEASMLADVGNFVNEEDESNNKANANFTVQGLPA